MFTAFSSFWNKIEKKNKSKIWPLHYQFFESWKSLNSNNRCRGYIWLSSIHIGVTWIKPPFFKANWIHFLRNLFSPLNSTYHFRNNILNFRFLLFLNANSSTKCFKQKHCCLPKVQKSHFSEVPLHFETKKKKKSTPKNLPLHGLFFDSWKRLNSKNSCRGCGPLSWIHVSWT